MNENHWYPRDPQRYLTDTQWCDHATEVAHNRMIDTFYALGKPLVDNIEELCNIGKIKASDYARVRGNLERLGWQFIDGLVRHKRIEETIAEQQRIREDRSKSGKIGNAVRWGAIANASQPESQTASQTHRKAVAKSSYPQPQPQPQPEQDLEPVETHTHRGVVGTPTLDEAKAYGSMIGLDQTEAERFWNHFESSGWIDRNSNPVRNWKSKMATWKADHQSKGAEASHHSQERNSGVSPSIKAMTGSKEYERVIARIKQLSNGAACDALGKKFYTAAESQELKTLRERRDVLKKELGLTI